MSKYNIDFSEPFNEQQLAWKLHQYVCCCFTGDHAGAKGLYPESEEDRQYFEEGLNHYREN